MSYCLISKNPVNTLLFAIYFSFLDIKQTVSTCPVLRVWYITFRDPTAPAILAGAFLFGFAAVIGYGCRIQEVFYVYPQEAGHFPKLVNVRAFPFARTPAFHGAVADPGLSAKFPAADSQRLALGVDWVLGLRHLLSLLLYKFTAFAVILQDAILPYKRSILWTSCALRLRRLCGITQTSKTKGVRPTRRFVP